MTQPAEDFSDFPVAANDTAAVPQQPPTLGIKQQDTSAYLAHVKALTDAGATKQQIEDYVRSQGLDPSLIQGLDEVLKYRDAGGKDYGVAGQGQPPAPPPAQQPEDFNDFPTAPAHDPSLLDQIERGAGLAGRAALRGFGQLTDLVSAPLKAVQDIGSMIAPNYISPAPNDRYTQAADAVGNSVGLPTPQNAAERINDAALSGATGGLITAGGASVAGGGSTIAKMIAASPGLEMAGGAGSGGAAQIAKEEGFGPWVQLGAALVGGPLAAGSIAAGSRIPGLRPSNRELTELGKSFERQDVPMMPAMTGRTVPQMATGVTHMTLGGIPLADAAEKSILAARAARTRIANEIGSIASDPTAAGQAVQRGSKSFLETSEAKGSKLYEAIPISPQKPAILTNTKTALADLNAGLESNPELSGLITDPRLKAYQAALEGKSEQVPTGLLDSDGNPMMRTVQKGGNLSWGDLKAFRTYIGELAGRPTLQESTAQGALKRLYASLSDDMQATAAADGPKSLAAFNRANTFWRARQGRIDNVLSMVLGPKLDKGGQATFNQIESWARNKGDAIKLGQLLRSLPEDEAATVRATVFDRLGLVSPGRQDATGTLFSPNDFVTHWNGLSDRAKATLFPGIEYRSDIDDMVRIAAAMKDANKYANVSRTSLGTNALALLGAFFSNPLYAMGMAGTEMGAGKLLASQRFARWLASAPKKPNGPAALAHINRLATIAQAEPPIANEVLQLQQRLAEAFRNGGSMPLAASPPAAGQNENGGASEVPQQ